MNRITRFIPVFFALGFLFWSCDNGRIGGADQTETYYPGNKVFEERMGFLCGVWYSHTAGARLDGYRVRKWGDLTAVDKAKVQALFPGLNINSPKTCSKRDVPQNGDYVIIFDDTVYGQDDDDSPAINGNWGYSYMGMARAINIFNGDKDRGAIIIEYFEGADPSWLSDPDGYAYQGLMPGEKPFFGLYYRALDHDTVQMAYPVDLAAMNNGGLYYTEQETLAQAVSVFDVENEAEFISWGVVIPQEREK